MDHGLERVAWACGTGAVWPAPRPRKLSPARLGVEHKALGEDLDKAMGQLDYYTSPSPAEQQWLLIACNSHTFKWIPDNLNLFWWIADDLPEALEE